ncbi:MAG: methyltransferase [Chloroflexi bacterium]|nr:methyltransferase [Chloroflexota bacterium]
MKQKFSPQSKTDPSALIRLRDSIYVVDLLVAATGWLDLFDWLSGNPSDTEQVCKGLQIERRPADVMLTLFAAMGLIRRKNGKHYLTETAKEYLTAGSPFSLKPYFETIKGRLASENMLKVLRTGEPAGWGSSRDEKEWVLAMEKPDVADSFTAAMNSRGAILAPALARKLDCTGHKSLLDIAGGSGIYACTVASAYPRMKTAVFEKPPVDRVAERYISSRGMTNRVSVIAGDMFDKLPSGYDIHLFSNVLHDWGEANVRKLLAKSFRALPAGGMIVIHDAHINEDKTGPLPVAEFSVLIMYTTEGKCYSIAEMREFLEGAGFVDMRYEPTAAHWSIITACNPGSTPLHASKKLKHAGKLE